MKNPINLGSLSLPIDVVTEALGLVGQRGSGKTHLLCVLCEELIAARAACAILDPLGVLWGLRAAKDGKHEGLPVVVLGGEHGDVPLESTAGRVIADWVVSERRPCVLDLSSFRKAEQRRFVTDFGSRVFQTNREPLHLVVDEADLFAPQRPQKDEAKMLGVFEDLVRRGRARGIGLSLATQRPAVLHKDVLTQVGALIALRIVGPQDRKAIEEWIRHHGSDAERKIVLDSLGSLPRGTAWFWSPGWLQILKRVEIRDRNTFDSSATPKVGGQRVAPKKLAPVDIEALRARIADTIKRAEAEDPRALRARVAELEHQLLESAKAATKVVAPAPKVVERPAVSEAMARRLETAIGRFHQAGIAAVEACRDVMAVMPGPDTATQKAKLSNGAASHPVAAPLPPAFYKRTPKLTEAASNGDATVGTGGLQRILRALAQRPQGLNRKQLAMRAGLSARSGTFDTYISRARTAGWIDGRGEMRITDAGVKALGSFAPLPTGQALLNYWIDECGGGAGRMLAALGYAYPKAMTRAELAEAAGLSERSGTFDTYVSRLRTLELIEGRGEMRASEEFFSG